jgi:hypothetical protein
VSIEVVGGGELGEGGGAVFGSGVTAGAGAPVKAVTGDAEADGAGGVVESFPHPAKSKARMVMAMGKHRMGCLSPFKGLSPKDQANR